jgi:hypothetical protein
MSLQELDSGSSGMISQAEDSDTGNLSPTVQWFRRAFPHFFKPGIVQARKAKPDPNPKKKPVTWRSVARLERGEISHVTLNINLKDRTYKLVCTKSVDGVGWPIKEATLLHIAPHGSEWVKISLDDKSVIKLRRSELLNAYNFLMTQV